jgi:hypothetical protein
LGGFAILCELETFVLPTLSTVQLWMNQKAASANWPLKHLLQKCEVHATKSVYQIWKKHCCIFNGTSCVYLIIMIWFEYQVPVKLLKTINIPQNMCWPLLQSCSPATPLVVNYCMVTLKTGCSTDSQLTVPIVPPCFMTIHFIEHNVVLTWIFFDSLAAVQDRQVVRSSHPCSWAVFECLHDSLSLVLCSL